MSYLPRRVFRLREDLKKFIIRQEEEPGEEEALLFQVLVEAFEDEFQKLVRLLQPLQYPIDVHNGQNMLILKGKRKTLHSTILLLTLCSYYIGEDMSLIKQSLCKI